MFLFYSDNLSKIASLQLSTVARLKVLGENALNFYQRWISNQTSIELFCLEVKFVLQLLINWDQLKTDLLYPSITCSKLTIKTLERDGGGSNILATGGNLSRGNILRAIYQKGAIFLVVIFQKWISWGAIFRGAILRGKLSLYNDFTLNDMNYIAKQLLVNISYK